MMICYFDPVLSDVTSCGIDPRFRLASELTPLPRLVTCPKCVLDPFYLEALALTQFSEPWIDPEVSDAA